MIKSARLTFIQVYYNSTIRKFNTSYQSTCENQQSVVSILRDVIIGEKDLPKAERLLLALPGLEAFSNNLGSAKEHAVFRQHITRYLKLYLPDCPFEISSTNRYTGTTFEATIISRRDI
jgi:histone-lysine N-methyltransferase SUV420H